MMKGEPNSPSFSTISKAVVESVRDEEPVRKAFQKIIMKTIGEHDLTKQEYHHILNGLEFVEFSRKFVSVNIMGTQRVRTSMKDMQLRKIGHLVLEQTVRHSLSRGTSEISRWGHS